MSIKPKVLFLVTQMEAGGAQAQAYSIYKSFVHSGVDARLLFLYKKSESYSEEGIEYIYDTKPEGMVDNAMLFLRFMIYVWRYKPAWIFSFSHFSNFFAAATKMILRVKVVASQTSLFGFISKKFTKIDLFLGRYFYDQIIFNSKTTEKSFIEHASEDYVNKCQVIFLGVDKESELTKKQARKKLGIGEGQAVYFMCSRLAKEKGISFVVSAFKERDMKNGVLMIAGEGEMKEELLEMTRGSENIKLLGEVAPSDVHQYYRAADCFLSSSLTESFGLSVAEALQNNCVLYISDIDVYKELFSYSPNVFFFSRTGDHLERLLSEKIEWENDGVVFPYTEEAMAKSYLSLIE